MENEKKNKENECIKESQENILTKKKQTTSPLSEKDMNIQNIPMIEIEYDQKVDCDKEGVKCRTSKHLDEKRLESTQGEKNSLGCINSIRSSEDAPGLETSCIQRLPPHPVFGLAVPNPSIVEVVSLDAVINTAETANHGGQMHIPVKEALLSKIK